MHNSIQACDLAHRAEPVRVFLGACDDERGQTLGAIGGVEVIHAGESMPGAVLT